MERVTTSRAVHHQVIDTAHHNRIVAEPDQAFDRTYTAPQPRVFLLIKLFKLFRPKILGNDVSRNQFAAMMFRGISLP
jgi:hypothetical protein